MGAETDVRGQRTCLTNSYFQGRFTDWYRLFVPFKTAQKDVLQQHLLFG